MSDTHPQATDPSNAEKSRWDLLELDIPAPTLPAWLATLVTAIAAILPRVVGADAAFEALRALCAPVARDPRWLALADTDPGKVAVREAKAAKEAEIRAVLAATRQAIPTVQAAPAPVTVSAPVTAPAPLGPVLVGHWRKDDNGNWCALMPLAPNTRAPRVGDIVAVERRNGHRENKRVVALVKTTQGNGPSAGHLVAVEPASEPANYRAAIAVPGPGITATPEQTAAINAALATPVNSELATEDNALAQDLALAAGESQHNATTQASGSMADGSMRGVGFSTAAGYVQALANGVKAATAESYKSTLRASYGYTDEQIAALTVTIIPEASLPVGAGITHTPTGPSIFDMPKAQRSFRVGESKTKADVRALISERDFIAGAVAHGSMMQASWTGSGQSTCEAFNAKLAPLGLDEFAPAPPSAERHAGDAVASLRGRDYDTTRLPSVDLPDGIKARWCVGRKLTGKAIKAGDAYGNALLIVSLHDDETISFDGDATLATAVRNHYATATAKEILRSNTLTPWLSGLLRNRFRAVKRGHVWYVPGGQAEQARVLIEAIAPLWGDHELIPVTTGKDLMRSLTRGLSDEVAALAKELADKTDDARDLAEKKARKECEEKKISGTHGEASIVKLARERATVSARVANSISTKLATVAARVDGYSAALGEESVTAVKAEIAKLRVALEPLSDDASLRAALLELA